MGFLKKLLAVLLTFINLIALKIYENEILEDSLVTNKRGCVFPMVIWHAFRMVQLRVSVADSATIFTTHPSLGVKRDIKRFIRGNSFS